MVNSIEVLQAVLSRAELTEPSAHLPLWKYPIQAVELEALRSEFARLGGVPQKLTGDRQGALALLMAHLVCEHLSSGAWRWEPVLSALGWSPGQNDMHRLRAHLGDGLECYWKRPVRLMGGDREYLASLLIEGGLPLCWLTGDGGPRVQQLLQRLVRLVERHRVSATSLVNEHLELLPATLRSDVHLAELIANMADALVQLRRQLPAGCESPADYLDKAMPGWRERLPVPRMRTSSDVASVDRLVAGLLVAKSEAERDVPLVVLEWRLAVTADVIVRELVLATRISAGALAQETQLAEERLPWTLYLCLESSGGRRAQVARLERVADGSAYAVLPTGGKLRIVDRDEWRATLYANQALCGELSPLGGDVLDEGVPWVFDDYERSSHLLLACGSCDLRSETLIVSLPASAAVRPTESGDLEPISELRGWGRSYYRVLGTAVCTVDGEEFVVTSARKDAPAATRLRIHGRRSWLGTSGEAPLHGVPRVIAENDEVAFDVPAAELEWRPAVGFGQWRSWRADPPVGTVSIRWRRQGRTYGRIRATILPADFVVSSFGGQHGLRLSAACLESVVALDESPVTIAAKSEGEFRVTAGGARPSTCELAVRLCFSGGCACEIRLPIPNPVAGFVESNGVWLPSRARRSLMRSDALRARGGGASEFQLEARCDGAPWEVVAVVKAGATGWAQLHLDSVREHLQSLLASTNLDGVVELRFCPHGRPSADSPRLLLSNYGLSIDYEVQCGPTGETVGYKCVVRAQDEQAREDTLTAEPTLKVVSLACPWEPWVPAVATGNNQFWVAADQLKPGPHLVVAFHGALMRTRPKLLGIRGAVDTSVSHIAAPATETDFKRRGEQWRALIAAMGRDFWHPAWADLDKLIAAMDALPPSTFEILRHLADDADACAMLLMRQPTVDHQRIGVRVLVQLGVLPETIPLPSWFRAMSAIAEGVRGRSELVGALGGLTAALDTLARASFGSQASGALPLCDVLRCLAQGHIEGVRAPAQDYMAIPAEAIGQLLRREWQTLLARHADDRWPQSTLDMRLETYPGAVLDCNGYQRDVQAAPLYAATATFGGDPLSKRAVAQLHQLKSFDRIWFEMAYGFHLTMLAQRRPAVVRSYFDGT